VVNRNRRILVCGAGIAGSCLAYWLVRYGFQPTLIERAPRLRTGGYIIDFWGRGYDVADRMGLLPALEGDAYRIEELRLVDARGRQRGGFSVSGLRAVLDERLLSILRGDLARRIYESLEGAVPTIFGDSVSAIDQDEDGVTVAFEHGPPQRFDLVVGAGGLHSPIRRLVFGPGAQFEKYLGYYAASFAAPGYPERDTGAYVTYAAPGRQVSRFALRGDRTVFLFVFAADRRLPHPHDPAAQRAVLHRVFGTDGWECPTILAALDASPELYFDAVSQVRMPVWHSGRVALVGDACFAPSLLAGQGAALAMTAAYIMAGELTRADGEHQRAFAAYQAMLAPFIARKQRAAERFARSFAPRTARAIRLRNYVTRLMSAPLVAPLVTRLVFGRLLADPLPLPVYP
jgi:2-polyprenyl-6-methoxyphenol hydroxylase-like FAD-dependent oxidoreductase